MQRLIGRQRELKLLREELGRPDARLVTLVGPGGCGKTRLAAAVLEDARFQPVRFVDLSPLGDPALVPAAVARGVGVEHLGTRAPLDALADVLPADGMLIVLDNFEQVLSAAAFVDGVMDRYPSLRILVTSREALGIEREVVLQIEPLEVPRRERMSTAALARVPSVALFLERCRQRRAAFRIDERNAAAVAQVCARLDGLPLAIELAAAWSDLLTPVALLERLGERLDILADEEADRPPRHRTLRAAISWSYDLLSAAEARLFRRLAVFPGGCSVAGAEAVADAKGPTPAAVLAPLRRLCQKSLLRADERHGEIRFRMLDTIREFALERLEADPDAERTRALLAEHGAAFAEAAERELVGPDQARWLARVDLEHDNLREALRWTVERDRPDVGLRIAASLWVYFEARGYYAEAWQWLFPLLASPSAAGRTALRAKALHAAATLVWRLGDQEATFALERESLAISRELGDERGEADSLHQLGFAYHRRGDDEEARRVHEACLEIRRRLGDRRGVAAQLNALGEIARTAGDLRQARDLYAEALDLFRETQDVRGRAVVLHNVAHVSLLQGDAGEARTLLRESLALGWELRNRRLIGEGLAGLAAVAVAGGDYVRASRHLADADRLFVETGMVLNPADRQAYQRTSAALAQSGTAAAAPSASVEEAVRFALTSAARPARPATAAELSDRQSEVAGLVAEGLTNKEIAAKLGITEGTARAHLEQILTRLDLRSRAQLAAWVARHGSRSRDT